jgi:rRNA-processing protein EBP2
MDKHLLRQQQRALNWSVWAFHTAGQPIISQRCSSRTTTCKRFALNGRGAPTTSIGDNPPFHVQIKERLLFEQKKITAVESRKRDKESATFAKQVAAERVKQKAAEKRSHDDSLKQWRKHKDSRTDLSKPEDLDALFAAGGARDRSSTAASRGKRKAKDRNYGFGGAKRFRKENTSGSSSSMKDFSMARNKALPPGVKSKSLKNSGAHRAGKRARSSKASKRSS